jgi:hypothetical protein
VLGEVFGQPLQEHTSRRGGADGGSDDVKREVRFEASDVLDDGSGLRGGSVGLAAVPAAD